MKVSPDSRIVSDFGFLMDPKNFESTLPPTSTLAKAYADPASSYFTEPDTLVRKLTATSIGAFRFVGAGVAVDLGIPTSALDNFGSALSLAGADQAVNQWVAIIGGLQDVIIDVAVEAMGAVPIVGWVVRAGKALIDGIVAAAASKRPRPPFITYDHDDDEFQARERIGFLRGTDWTNLFRPGWNTDGEGGDWGAPLEQDTSYLWRPRAKFVSGGLGCIPGGALGSMAVQSRNCFSAEPGDSTDEIRRRSLDCIANVYDTTPSASRVALAAWQSMTASASATLFNVDTRGIVDEWKRYCESGIATARFYQDKHGNKTPNWYFEMAARNLEAAMYVRGFKTVDRAGRVIPSRSARLDDVARVQTENLRERQEYALNTLLPAYASRSQAAFRDPKLAELLDVGRSRLLSSTRKWLVDRKDIVDVDFRESLVDATPASQRPPNVEGGTGRLPMPPLPMPEPDLDDEDGEGGGGGLLVVAGLLGAGWLAKRLIWR